MRQTEREKRASLTGERQEKKGKGKSGSEENVNEHK